MAQNNDVTLYFTKGEKPTSADTTRAAKIPGIVKFRNVEKVVSVEGGVVEASDYVTAGLGVDIPVQYDAVTRRSPEKPTLTVYPEAITIDLSDTEHADLRAIASFIDGTEDDVTTLCAWSSSVEAKATVGAATGIVTPLEAGATVITALYPWEGQGEGTESTAVLTAGGTLPAVDEVVVIGANTYVWKAAPTTVALQVKIGLTPEECLRNLSRAISKGPGGGTLYGSLTVEHPTVQVTGLTATTLSLEAKQEGVTGAALTSTETGSAFSFADTTFAGGTSATGISATSAVTVAA